MNHLGDTNKMVSETPRMDASAHDDGAIWETGCDIERELNAANQHIKRLEEALSWYESKVEDCNRHGSEGVAARNALAKDLGLKAREAKL
jgi:hypothetical protein